MIQQIPLTKRRTLKWLLVLAVLLGAAWAQTETVLYNFCAHGGDKCSDGSAPIGALIFDQAGNLYGTTSFGGAHGRGVAFKVTPKGEETVLYSFCTLNDCADGSFPQPGLIFDQQGNLYGTTLEGGTHNKNLCRKGCGVVFRLSPEGGETVLYSFCAHDNFCPDGLSPDGLAIDQKGTLYGTTYGGGVHNNGWCYEGCGLVFKLSSEGKETILYRFCAHNHNCVDGLNPNGLTFDSEGNLYGTTMLGGVHELCALGSVGCGVVFKLTPQGKETVLYSFCALGGGNCTDGQFPNSGLAFDQKGNIYGTTEFGGESGTGTVFKLTPTGKETVLHSFCALNDCSDGQAPSVGLVIDQKGNLYGTTYYGGAYYGECDVGGSGCGVVFKVAPKGEETVLYSFCAQDSCTDGAQPQAGLVIDQKGDLYGTTVVGGAYDKCSYYGPGCGVVFKLTP